MLVFSFVIEGPNKTFVGYANNQNFEKINEYLYYIAQGWLDNTQEVITNMGLVALPNYLYEFFENFKGDEKTIKQLPHSAYKDKAACDQFKWNILREQARYVYSKQVQKIDRIISSL